MCVMMSPCDMWLNVSSLGSLPSFAAWPPRGAFSDPFPLTSIKLRPGYTDRPGEIRWILVLWQARLAMTYMATPKIQHMSQGVLLAPSSIVLKRRTLIEVGRSTYIGLRSGRGISVEEKIDGRCKELSNFLGPHDEECLGVERWFVGNGFDEAASWEFVCFGGRRTLDRCFFALRNLIWFVSRRKNIVSG